MSSTAARGAALVAVAAVLAFLVLRGAADNSQIPVAGSADALPTVVVTPDPELTNEDPGGVDVGPETAVVDTGDARPNSEVEVLVANGTLVTGQASRLTSQLRNQGFQTREPKTADPQPTSTIFYRPGFAAEAAVVRLTLGGTTPIAPLDTPDPFIGTGIDLTLVDVLVLVGADDLADS